jgi:hypothetical protein
MTPLVLEQLFGTEEISAFGDDIEYGFIRDGNYFIKLKDKSEHRIGPLNLRLIK